MTKTETAKLFTLLGQFYPNKSPTTELRLAWELALEPYAYEDVRTAAIAYARGNKFFPTLTLNHVRYVLNPFLFYEQKAECLF